MAHGIDCFSQGGGPADAPDGPAGGASTLTRRDPRRPVFPDRVQRVFAADAPNRLWVADLTQHSTEEVWLYLATVLDAFSREVVGRAMGERPTAELVIDTRPSGIDGPVGSWSIPPTAAPSTPPWPSAAASRPPGSWAPWARWAMPWTSPSYQACWPTDSRARAFYGNTGTSRTASPRRAFASVAVPVLGPGSVGPFPVPLG